MEKPAKIEQRKVQKPDREPQVKKTAFLASPAYTGQAQGEEKKTYIFQICAKVFHTSIIYMSPKHGTMPNSWM